MELKKKMTSAYANKLLKQLEEEKNYWLDREQTSCTYRAFQDETPVIPEYSYPDVQKILTEIDEKVVKIKHAINCSNAANTVAVGGKTYTVDMILVRMAQLNRRKETLDTMRKRQEKTRVNTGYGSKAVAEYSYINYSLADVKADYEAVTSLILEMQMALDRYNQTVEFEVDL